MGLTVLHSHLPIFKIHEIFTGFWLCTNILNMLLCSYLEQNLFRTTRSLVKLRRYFVIISIFTEFFMLYFYFRHNSSCEPYIYSYFCVCEYAVIILNMLYHMLTPSLIEYPLNFIKSCTSQIPSSNNNNNKSEEMTELLLDNS